MLKTEALRKSEKDRVPLENRLSHIPHPLPLTGYINNATFGALSFTFNKQQWKYYFLHRTVKAVV